MITMEMIGKIRRMYLRDRLSLHEITKRAGLSRNTIRKWLKSPKEAAPPTYRRSERPCKLNAFHELLEQALKADAHRSKQNRRTAKDLFAQIKQDGYTGSYSRVTDFIRDWRGREGKTPANSLSAAKIAEPHSNSIPDNPYYHECDFSAINRRPGFMSDRNARIYWVCSIANQQVDWL